MDGIYKTVEEAVCAHTGMDSKTLLLDTRKYRINELDRASEKILSAAQNGVTVYIVGDYDVDGMTASSILALMLKEIGAHVFVRIPKRFSEGYGIQASIVKNFKPGSLMITVDNGIKAFDAFEEAKNRGIYTILIDHHLPDTDENGNPIWPDADIVIDPNAVPDSADFTGYCGAGLAYRLAVEVLGKEHKLIPKLTSLAAIGTIADSVPLVMENRRIVREGMQTLLTKEGRTAGLYALLKLYECDKYIDEQIIGYKIAPALNAPARLFDSGAIVSFKLLTFDGSNREAFDMAERQKEHNDRRKRLTEYWVPIVEKNIEENRLSDDFSIVTAYEPDIPEGIVGIVVGRMAEKYQKPCILFANTENKSVLKGSGRSYGDTNLKELLDRVSSLLLKYGGHAAAAGISITKENLDPLREALNETCSQMGEVGSKDESANPPCDLSIHVSDMDSVFSDVVKYGPYGVGNPELRIHINNIKLLPKGNGYYHPFGNGGVRFNMDAAVTDAMSFSLYDRCEKLKFPERVNLTGMFSVNYFNGRQIRRIIFDDIEECAVPRNKSLISRRISERAEARYGKNT